MEIRQIERVVLVWDCGDPRHAHRERKAAFNCASRRAARQQGAFKRITAAQRAQKMAELRAEGFTLSEIGELMGCSGRYVSATLRYRRDREAGVVKSRTAY